MAIQPYSFDSRIFSHRRSYVYIANLTDHPVLVPFLGRCGIILPPLQEGDTPRKVQYRFYKSYAMRQRMKKVMAKFVEPTTTNSYGSSDNPWGVIALCDDSTVVQTAITAELAKSAD